jgi:glycosyltransferase involved in cell wall biosynthesis
MFRMSGIIMLAICILIALIVLVTILVLSERNYRRLNELPTTTAHPSASVAIIIPARNESAVIERLIRSLIDQRYLKFHVTVVDDASTDDTADKAQAAGATVLSLKGDPPPGWTGKCNACHQAAQFTQANWLLFTDADTFHQPDSLQRAVAYAEQRGLDALSLLLRQECGTIWERLVLPLAYQNYFATLRPGKPAFNGQYILIRREAYERSGGFGAVRGRVMEDVALANVLARQGYGIELANGHAVASVRMYQDLPALLRGMTKTAYAAARDRGYAGFLIAASLLFSVTAPLLTLAAVLAQNGLMFLGGAAIMGLTAAGLIPWLRRFRVNPAWLYALLSPIGVTVLFCIGFTSAVRTLAGFGVRWKGRTIIEQREQVHQTHADSNPANATFVSRSTG